MNELIGQRDPTINTDILLDEITTLLNSLLSSGPNENFPFPQDETEMPERTRKTSQEIAVHRGATSSFLFATKVRSSNEKFFFRPGFPGERAAAIFNFSWSRTSSSSENSFRWNLIFLFFVRRNVQRASEIVGPNSMFDVLPIFSDENPRNFASIENRRPKEKENSFEQILDLAKEENGFSFNEFLKRIQSTRLQTSRLFSSVLGSNDENLSIDVHKNFYFEFSVLLGEGKIRAQQNEAFHEIRLFRRENFDLSNKENQNFPQPMDFYDSSIWFEQKRKYLSSFYSTFVLLKWNFVSRKNSRWNSIRIKKNIFRPIEFSSLDQRQILATLFALNICSNKSIEPSRFEFHGTLTCNFTSN